MNNKVSLSIWGRKFELDIIYQDFGDDSFTKQQNEVVSILPKVDMSKSLDEVKKYIYKRYSDELDEIEIGNVFKYVIPKSIFVLWDEKKRVFAIMCDFRFDMEHGLAVVFEDEQVKSVGAQDIVL